MKRLFAAIAAMMLVPTMASAGGKMVSVTELREQVETKGRWTADYTDQYGRVVHVDIKPIMDQYGAVPIILAKKVNAIDEIVLPENAIQREENGYIFAQVEENGRETELIIGQLPLTSNHITIETKNKNGNEGKTDEDIIENKTYEFDENELKENTQLNEELKHIIEEMNAEIKKYIGSIQFDFSIFRAGIDDDTGNYKCTLRQNMEGIPVLVGAWDTILKINENDINFKIPVEWSGENMFKYGDFFLPSWMLESDMDGNFSFLFWAIQATGKMVDDVPLRNISDVIQSVEEKITDGHIRNVYSLRFGYCCYPAQNEEIILYPVWEIECDYVFDPKQEMCIYPEDDGIPITSGRYYSTMIVNAQTGEFMNPAKLKEKLLDCPKIITWEDIQ